MSRILPRKFQGACLWLVNLNNNQTRAPSCEGGENRASRHTPVRLETEPSQWLDIVENHESKQSFWLANSQFGTVIDVIKTLPWLCCSQLVKWITGIARHESPSSSEVRAPGEDMGETNWVPDGVTSWYPRPHGNKPVAR